MCACDEYPGHKCAAHRALPDYRCDDYPELTAHDAETVAALYLALTPDEHAYMMNPKGGKPR